MKKKNLYLTVVCILLSIATMAQKTNKLETTLTDTVYKAIKNGYQFNTGTLQDILTNYLQVAAKNITTTNTSLQLKLNWFALNGMDSASKYNNVNFLKTAWQRNGEFITSVGVDKDNKFNSWQGGITYNFLSRRDTTMAYYEKAYVKPFIKERKILLAAADTFNSKFAAVLEPMITKVMNAFYPKGHPIVNLKDSLIKKLSDMLQGNPSDDIKISKLEAQFKKDSLANLTIPGTEMKQAIKEFAEDMAADLINAKLNRYIKSQGVNPLKFPQYIPAQQTGNLIAFIDKRVANDPFFRDTLQATTLIALNKKVIADYNALVRYVGRQPLLTAGYLYTYGKGTILSSHVGSINFLYGTGSWNTLKTGQIKASLTDTLNSNDPTGKVRNFKRNIVSLQVGYNQVLAMQKKVSVMELSGALELNSATSGYVSGTNKSKFYFDAYFRARLPSTPWLKFDLKWDPKDGNVLGFFNFTYNLDKP